MHPIQDILLLKSKPRLLYAPLAPLSQGSGYHWENPQMKASWLVSAVPASEIQHSSNWKVGEKVRVVEEYCLQLASQARESY